MKNLPVTPQVSNGIGILALTGIAAITYGAFKAGVWFGRKVQSENPLHIDNKDFATKVFKKVAKQTATHFVGEKTYNSLNTLKNILLTPPSPAHLTDEDTTTLHFEHFTETFKDTTLTQEDLNLPVEEIAHRVNATIIDGDELNILLAATKSTNKTKPSPSSQQKTVQDEKPVSSEPTGEKNNNFNFTDETKKAISNLLTEENVTNVLNNPNVKEAFNMLRNKMGKK